MINGPTARPEVKKNPADCGVDGARRGTKVRPSLRLGAHVSPAQLIPNMGERY